MKALKIGAAMLLIFLAMTLIDVGGYVLLPYTCITVSTLGHGALFCGR